MSLRVLIVDDEQDARQGLRALLLAQGDATLLVEEAENGLAALSKIPVFKPDIVFLDVEMPGMGGLAVLENLKERPFQLVFQTAHPEFALSAFDHGACDYLLKPFSDERFAAAFAKARAGIERVPATSYLTRFSFKLGARFKIVEASQVNCVLAVDQAVRAHVEGGGDYETEQSLDELEAKLDPNVFVRIHRGALINLRALKSVQTGNPMTVTLRDGRVLVVAKERRARLRPLLTPR